MYSESLPQRGPVIIGMCLWRLVDSGKAFRRAANNAVTRVRDCPAFSGVEPRGGSEGPHGLSGLSGRQLYHEITTHFCDFEPPEFLSATPLFEIRPHSQRLMTTGLGTSQSPSQPKGWNRPVNSPSPDATRFKKNDPGWVAFSALTSTNTSRL